MTCQVVLWFEGLYLVIVGLISWRIAKLQMNDRAFLFSAAGWIAAGFVLFWIVEFVAVSFATGGYAREQGWCPPEAAVERLGSFALIWIPLFAVSCIWARAGGRNKLSDQEAQK